jgi:class 3 adenylate cyclase
VHAPFRPYFMIRRREGDLDSRHHVAISTLWDFLLDYVGARRERSQLAADRAPVSRRPQAVLLGVDIVNFTLMRQEHQRTAVRLLNSLTQQVVASIDPVRRALWTAISTGDGLILVLDGALAPTPLFDAMVAINLALAQVFETLGRNLGLGSGVGARMALHSGPVLTVYDPGGDLNFVGPGVNVLQRILEFGNAGQVLATDEGFAAMHGADGFDVVEHVEWGGWDKHGIDYHVRSVWGERFGDPNQPARLDQRFRPL